MKKWTGILLAAMLILTTACAWAAEGVTLTTPYFTLQLPAGWEVDMEDLENKDGIQDLGYFYDSDFPGLAGGAYLEYYEDWKDVSLWNPDEEQMKEYKDALLESLEGNRPEFLDTVMAGKVPLLLVRCENREGEFLYADTMTNGYVIYFSWYKLDRDEETSLPFTEKDIETVREILSTFQPVT